MTSITRDDIIRSPYALSEDDVDALVAFSDDCSRVLGSRLSSISLHGEPGMPVLSVVFTDDRRRPGVRYSYEWRLRDVDDPDDATPLEVMLIDHLGNSIQEDLETTPGLPMWEPDSQQVVHVDVRSDRYRAWPQEWRAMGRPWRDEAGVLRRLDPPSG